MPFRNEPVDGFAPEDLTILTQAFNAAWQQLVATGVKLNGDVQTIQLKTQLAHAIMADAIPGACNVEKLTLSGFLSLVNDISADADA
jgi:hypothetical protein